MSLSLQSCRLDHSLLHSQLYFTNLPPMAKEETRKSWRLGDVGNKDLGSQRGKAEKGDRKGNIHVMIPRLEFLDMAHLVDAGCKRHRPASFPIVCSLILQDKAS